MRRVRLVQLHLQPVFVADDGENLAPIDTQPLLVSAADWPTFIEDRWPELVAQLERDINADGSSEGG